MGDHRDGAPGPDFDERLRRSLSDAAPEALPTIGVRERIVDGVRSRVRRRQRVAGTLAVCCLVVAGVTTGVAALHSTQHPATNSAAPRIPASQGKGRVALPTIGPTSSGSSSQASRAECGEIVEDAKTIGGCYGVFYGSQDLSINQSRAEGSTPGGPVPPPTPTPSPVTPNPVTSGTVASNPVTSGPSTAGSTASGSTASGGGNGDYGTAQHGSTDGKPVPVDGTYRVLVPLDRPVTVVLPGIAGEVWSVPAVAAAQGANSTRVRLVGETAAAAGRGSSATFESSAPATVLVDASALDVCGAREVPCGASTGTWSIVLVFQGA